MRAGIFGYGLAGRVFHAPLLKLAGFEVVAIQTNNPDRAAQARADFPDAVICSSAEELLSHNLDLAVVASVNTAHESNAKAAIDAGVAVVVDKPMATTLATQEKAKVSIAASTTRSEVNDSSTSSRKKTRYN